MLRVTDGTEQIESLDQLLYCMRFACQSEYKSAVAPDRTVQRALCRAGLTCKLDVHSPDAVMTAAIVAVYVACLELGSPLQDLLQDKLDRILAFPYCAKEFTGSFEILLMTAI